MALSARNTGAETPTRHSVRAVENQDEQHWILGHFTPTKIRQLGAARIGAKDLKLEHLFDD